MSGWVHSNRQVLWAVAATLVLSCLAAIPAIGWQVGFGSVAGAALALAVLVAELRVERRAHERETRARREQAGLPT